MTDFALFASVLASAATILAVVVKFWPTQFKLVQLVRADIVCKNYPLTLENGQEVRTDDRGIAKIPAKFIATSVKVVHEDRVITSFIVDQSKSIQAVIIDS